MWKKDLHFERCLIQALETYQQILMESSLSSDENDHYYHDVYMKLKNKKWKELNLNIDNFNYKLIHKVNLILAETSPRYGVIIVLESENGKTLVLDGNHRINTLNELQDPVEFPVLLISGYLP